MFIWEKANCDTGKTKLAFDLGTGSTLRVEGHCGESLRIQNLKEFKDFQRLDMEPNATRTGKSYFCVKRRRKKSSLAQILGDAAE